MDCLRRMSEQEVANLQSLRVLVTEQGDGIVQNGKKVQLCTSSWRPGKGKHLLVE